VTVGDFSAKATCYAGLSGRVRPRADVASDKFREQSTMKIHPWVIDALLLGVLVVSNEVSTASPTDPTRNSCLQTSSNNEERSRSVARFLITYIEPYWDLAKTTKPLRDSVSLEDDPSADGSKLEFHDVEFKTFKAGFFKYADGSLLPSKLSTTSARFKLPCGLQIGQLKTDVSEVIGAPTYVRSNSFVYATGGDQNGEVILEFRRKKLWRIAWGYDTH
jgi:hypothetical protein